MAKSAGSVGDKILGALSLAHDGVAGGATRVQEMHQAIANKPYGVLRKIPGVQVGSETSRVFHDGIAGAVYDSIRGVNSVLFGVAAAAVHAFADKLETPPSAAGRSESPPRFAFTPLHEGVISALNGVCGDYLAQADNGLAIALSFRHQRRDLVLTGEALAAAYPQATPRLAIFVHGLACNEDSWQLYARQHWPQAAVPQTYADLLQAEFGCTPLFLRYNTGLRISANAEAMAAQLDQLVQHWPVPVERIELIGHSMGGLVIRGAAWFAEQSKLGWVGKVDNLICLGSPHMGAPLEKLGHVAAAALEFSDITRPLAKIAKARSIGIKDLRHGYITALDGEAHEPDAPFVNGRQQIARLPHGRYRFVGATLAGEGHPIGNLLGDGLVRSGSALALALAEAEGVALCRLNHLQLLNHPLVYAHLQRWLSEAPPP